MHKVTADRSWPLFDVAATRRLEHDAASALPPHALMERAGLAVARLALAVAPHARCIWIACGPGNNGGDGLEAGLHLHRWGKQVHLTLAGDPAALPVDAANALRKCREAGLHLATVPPADWDLGIDALLGIGAARPLAGELAEVAVRLNTAQRPVLAIDVPSGLSADTGDGDAIRATHTLSLLTLKPGLFTGQGRDASGTVWFDSLDTAPSARSTALLLGPPAASPRLQASHKGVFGDVAVIGGAAGMAGAAVLAATAALHAGAGRVFLAPLQQFPGALVAHQPELMVREPASLSLERMAVACGCGGGNEIAALLPRVLSTAGMLVLDADALNAIAADTSLQELLARRGARGRPTVLTPHPLEAARLLGSTTPQVQGDRLHAATQLAERFRCCVVLKGSGTVLASPGHLPAVNPTGNARLASGGTGDVLAGMLAAALAVTADAMEAAAWAVYRHGAMADAWPPGEPLTAGALARH